MFFHPKTGRPNDDDSVSRWKPSLESVRQPWGDLPSRSNAMFLAFYIVPFLDS